MLGNKADCTPVAIIAIVGSTPTLPSISYIMNIETTKIFLTYSLGEKYLVRPGKYEAAVIAKGTKTVKFDCGIIDKEMITKTPMRMLEAPQYADSTQCIELSDDFVKHALTRPIKPKRGFNRWMRTGEGELFQNWNKLTPETRLKKAIENYVKDVTNQEDPVFSYEII